VVHLSEAPCGPTNHLRQQPPPLSFSTVGPGLLPAGSVVGLSPAAVPQFRVGRNESRMIRSQLIVAVLMMAALGRAEQSTIPDVIAMPLPRLVSPLSGEQISSLERTLSKQEPRFMADVEKLLPPGFVLVPVSYVSCGARSTNGTPILFTKTVSVCRLSETRDLVVAEDDNTPDRVGVVRKWIIREITAPNPQGGANGSQPLRSDTNRTSSAAASRRSP
jgi:hypothetical protein